MPKLRDAVVFLAVCLAFVISLLLIRQIIGFRSPWFGLIVMLDCLGLAAFARPFAALRVPVFLLKPWGWERRGSVTNVLRIHEFGDLLRRTALRHLNPVVYLKDNPQAGVVQSQIESAEAAHVFATLVLLPWIAFAYIDREWIGLAALLLVEIFGNLYPILHLRSARMRLARVRSRIERARRDENADTNRDRADIRRVAALTDRS